ncbi:DUF3054 family protein [Haloactinospora alba]|uniref:DUF3054 family protein n=1 Tax=Haloactinospora alba TaxID=405555 RepID=A0A543NLT8_9ACTN|nr:DUF3054 domain-containing protein [Haloactinospora alba]TQN32779.1 DUF3054 family protein [Haloactinospora alba]
MRTLSVPGAAVADLLCLLAFVTIGRASHDEGNALAGIATTVWPFAAALAVSWLATLAWRAPARLVPSGLGIWAGTTVGGLVLRVATGAGAEPSFAVVTALFLAATLLGWRAVTRLARVRASRSTG